MDIVNRLNSFMEVHGIGSTQFADACGIPRPTLSQILSGRNKKISDAVISKIHNAYPSLSVLWLLFGEGQMESSPNIGFSEAQKNGQTNFQSVASHDFNPTHDDVSDSSVTEDSESLFGSRAMNEPLIFDDDEPMHEVKASHEASSNAVSGGPTVTIPADGSKSIVNIMVFYSDNSYQSFVPR